MTDKVQKIKEWIRTRKLCTMDEHMKFYSKEAESDYTLLCSIEKVLDSLQEDPKPKFKVGDWIINNSGSVFRITSVIGEKYFMHILNDDYCVFETDHYNIDKDCRLWTIQDVKDGDVVVDKSDGAIGIFQSIGHHPDGGSCNDPSYCFLHCRYDDGFFYADFEHGNTIDSDDLIPATKEQRDLLFKKMKEAGYEWDAEKKRLKKIEQKPADKSDSVLNILNKENQEVKPEDLIKKPSLITVGENKMVLSDVISILDNRLMPSSEERARLVKGLQSIKLQLNTDWSEEDKRIMKEIISMSKTLGKTDWIIWIDKKYKQILDYHYQPGWRKNYNDNKPEIKHSVLMLTTHGIAEGEWLGKEWYQYRWSCKVKDSEVLYWMHLSDLESLEKEDFELDIINENQGYKQNNIQDTCDFCDQNRDCIDNCHVKSIGKQDEENHKFSKVKSVSNSFKDKLGKFMQYTSEDLKKKKIEIF